MSVLDRAALEASPLADLHAIASELSIDGYRRLRRPQLIDAILARQAGEEPESVAAEAEETAAVPAEEPAGDESAETQERAPARRRRGRRGGRGQAPADEESAPAELEQAEDEPAKVGDVTADGAPADADEEPAGEEEIVTGVVELLPNGSGFVRVDPPEPDGDVYISAAQVKRCELVSGDRISGPGRAPRRSERFASLVRVDTINDRPAHELADSARFDDLPAAFPSERFRFGSDDPTVQAIEWLTPIGRGSRVTIVGPSGAGKTESLRRLAAALARDDELRLSVALVGVRPEEISEWSTGAPAPTAAVGLAASPDAQAGTVELVVDQARRIAARGANAVALIDSLDGVHSQTARKALAAARNIVDGGSLTVIATASKPIGGETTVIALDRALAATGRFPALDVVASGTMRAELLVGDDGAEAIVRARLEALEGPSLGADRTVAPAHTPARAEQGAGQ
jgi:transcription termination factor Rho